MTNPNVRIKRSSVAGKRPTISQLELGELALNTNDGRLFTRKYNVGIGSTVTLLSPWTENIGGGLYYTEGNIGIGLTNPSSTLDISGTVNISGVSTFSNNVNIAGTVSIGTTVDIVPYDDLGTLSFEGSAGQLFSITNNLTSGSIFSVNDVSGIPSIDVDADGTIQLAPYGSNEYVGVGLTNPTAKLHVAGDVNVSGIITATTFDGSLATSNLTGTITNTQLAGSITNDKLVNSSVNFGGVTVSLGGNDSTPAFDLQDATGLPISTGISGLAANVATFLATPSSANLKSAVTDETGSGALVFATSPTLVTPTLGAASATSINVSGIVTANSYNVGTDAGISTTRTTVATTSATTIESFAIDTYRSARVQVQITQGTDYQTSDVLIIHDGSTASVIEYASIATDDYLGTFTGAVSGGNCLLQINMSSVSSATVKVLSQKITV